MISSGKLAHLFTLLKVISSDDLGVFKEEPVIVRSYAVDHGYRRDPAADQKNS